MEQPKSLAQLMPISHELLSKTFQSNSVKLSNEISLYKGCLTAKVIVECSVRVKKAFPELPSDFFEVFQEMMKSEEFTDERLQDAVNYVIKTCIYPRPTIAQFISWDRRIKIYTYADMLKKWDEGIRNSYQPIKFPERENQVWVHIDDIKMYNLKSEYYGTK